MAQSASTTSIDAALIGIVIAAAGISRSVALGKPWIDSMASILNGLVLGAVAMLLARASKGLLIGERADPRVADALRRLAMEEPCVRRTVSIVTVHLAPDQIVATLSLEFDDSLRISAVEVLVRRIEQRANGRHDRYDHTGPR